MVGLLTQNLHFQLLFYSGLGKAGCGGETDMPELAAAVQCMRSFSRQVLPSQSRLWSWATKHNVYFSPFKKLFWSPEWYSKEKKKPQQQNQLHHDRGGRICMFLHFCFPHGFRAVYVPLQLLPLVGSFTPCAVLPAEDLVENFMRGSWYDSSCSYGIACRKWYSPLLFLSFQYKALQVYTTIRHSFFFLLPPARLWFSLYPHQSDWTSSYSCGWHRMNDNMK